MKVEHVASGTIFERNKKGLFEVIKQGTKNDCWVNNIGIGGTRPLNNIKHHLEKGWFVEI